jgi:signal transduction histidine kinase
MKIVFSTSLFGPLITSFNEKRDILKIQRDIALIVGDQGGLEERIERILKLLTRADPSAAAYYSLGKHGRFSMAAEHAVFEKLNEKWRDPLRTLSSETLYSDILTGDGPSFLRLRDKEGMQDFPWADAGRTADWNWAALLPVKSGRRILGLLVVVSKRRRNFSNNFRILLETAAIEMGEMVLRTQAEGSNARYLAELERSNKELEDFAYVVSHDLQEPLRTVRNFIQLVEAKYGDKLDEKGKSYIKRVVNGAERMRLMIDDLLGYSRVMTKGEEFVPKDLTDLLESAVENLRVTIKQSGAEIKAEKLPVVSVDPSQIIRVFQNLLSNAIKYVSKERSPKIRIWAGEIKDRWEVHVEDNGIGIADRYREEIFGVFSRLHGRDEYPGTGIGLAVCKRVLQRHNGDIWVVSVEEEGSTFTFSLPKHPADQRKTG